ncbi:hypothetical protein HJC23_009673 [Cyclotella cryptica]|uniref:Uncharacterized protein n=1 Tax=Cyclotella cryptica TaxID=29204 RepID=A0ABD3Q812_9STRA
MNQRILSCPSTLFTKGLTLKAGDWRSSEVMPETLDQSRMRRMSESVATLSSNWELTRNSSSSSLRKQFGTQRLSSSSLSSAKRDGAFNFQNNSTRGNASWDDNRVGGLASKQTTSGSLSGSLFDLVQINMDDPFKPHGHRTKRSSCPTISESAAEETSPHVYRKRSSLSDLVPKRKEEASFKGFSLSGSKNPMQDEDKHVISLTYADIKKSSSREDFAEFVVKTSNETSPKQIDIRRTSSSELASLKENDPFMYYSIPAVRSAAMHGNAIDLLTFQEAARSLNVPSNYVRKTCISVEACIIPNVDEIDYCDLANLSLDNIHMELGEDVDLEDDWLYSFSEIQTSN